MAAISAVREAITAAVEAVTVPASAAYGAITSLRRIDTMDLLNPGMDDPHLTFLVEHRSTVPLTRQRSESTDRSVFDLLVQVRARIGTIDGQTDADLGLDVAEAIRMAMATDLLDGLVSCTVDELVSLGADSQNSRYMYRMAISATHYTG